MNLVHSVLLVGAGCLVAACETRREYRPPDCLEYTRTEWVVRAELVASAGTANMLWTEPSATPVERAVRLTNWRVLDVERTRPFPQTSLPPLPTEFAAVDLSPDSTLGSRHLLFLRRVDQDPFDAGLIFWSNFSFFEVDAGLWTRGNIRVPAITEAAMMDLVAGLDSEPYCARDATECTTTQNVCHQAEDGGSDWCVPSTRSERCLVDGGVIDGG